MKITWKVLGAMGLCWALSLAGCSNDGSANWQGESCPPLNDAGEPSGEMNDNAEHYNQIGRAHV